MTDLEKDIKQGILGLGNVAPRPAHELGAETDEERSDSDAETHEGHRDFDAATYEERDDANWRPGSRDIDEGGGVNSQVSGTRNMHATGGATGGDLGNRPE